MGTAMSKYSASGFILALHVVMWATFVLGLIAVVVIFIIT